MDKVTDRIVILTAMYVAALMVMVNSFPLLYTSSINLAFLILVNYFFSEKNNCENSLSFKSTVFVTVPFIIVPVVWVLFAVFYRWDWLLVWQTISSGASGNFLLTAMESILREYRIDIQSICEIFCLISIIFTARIIWICKKSHKESLLNGLSLGLFIVAILCGLYILFDYNNQSRITPNFWDSINRKAGLCTDPNALGLFSFLAIALMLSIDVNSKIVKWLNIFSYLILGMVSGSRSFILGIALLVVISTFSKLIKKRSFILVAVLILSLVSLPTFISLVDLNFIYESTWIPESIKRTLISIHTEGFWNSIVSRIIFWKLALAKFAQNPISGAGFNQFERRLAEFSSNIDINLNGWIDNSNSFYLGILAEQGLVGVLAILLGLASVTWSNNWANTYGKLSIAVFLVLLLFGPHFDFIEVSSLFGLLLGVTFNIQLRSKILKFTSTCLILIALFLLFPVGSLNSQISYGVFSRNQKIFVRSSGRIKVGCDQNILTLNLSVPGKDIDEIPTSVIISSLSKMQEVLLSNDKAQSLHVECLSKGQIVEITCSPIRIPKKEDLFRGVRPFCVAIELGNQ
jgi:hypothetical protein